MRRFLAIPCLAAALYFLLPLFGGILHIGMAVPALAFLVLALWCLWGRPIPRWLCRTLIALYTLAAVIAAVGRGVAADQARVNDDGGARIIGPDATTDTRHS